MSVKITDRLPLHHLKIVLTKPCPDEKTDVKTDARTAERTAERTDPTARAAKSSADSEGAPVRRSATLKSKLTGRLAPQRAEKGRYRPA